MSTQTQDREQRTNNDHVLYNTDYTAQYELGIIGHEEYMLREFGITDNGNNDSLWPDTSKDW